MTKTPDQFDQQVGERIRAARLAAGLSQTGLADALGLSFQQVQKYEKGTNRVAPGRLVVIAQACDTSAAALLGHRDERAPAVLTMMTTKEGQALATAFNDISSDDDRRALVTIATRMAHFSNFYRSTFNERASALQAAE